MTIDARQTAFHVQLKKLIGGKSVSAFARKCGLGESLIRQYLSGSLPRIDKVLQIARANNISVGSLIGDEKTSDSLPKKQAWIGEPVAKYETIRISEKLQKTAEILESKTIYRTALAANIDAFHHAVAQDNQVRKNEKELAAQQKRITDLESRIISLEKLLSSVSATPGDYQEKNKDNAA